jgi:hypothetical protein
MVHPRRSGRPKSLAVAALYLAVGLARAGAALAQVSCADPDNLCTGDPCVIPSMEVADPCVVDFGPRTVIVAGTLRPPPDGTVSLTAGAIDVQGRIVHPLAFFGSTSLIATNDIAINGAITGAGFSDRILTIDAGGNINTAKPITGMGTVILDAGGTVNVGRPIRLTRAITDGAISLTAGADITVGGSLRAVRGIPSQVDDAVVDLQAGGDITLTAPIVAGYRATIELDAVGDIDLQKGIKGLGFVGTLTRLTAGGTLTVGGPILNPGQDAILQGADGVIMHRSVKGFGFGARSLEISSSMGGVTIDGLTQAHHTEVLVSASADVLVNANMDVRGSGNRFVVFSSTLGDVSLNAPLLVRHDSPPLSARVDVIVSAAGTVFVNEDIDASGVRGELGAGRAGAIRIEAPDVQVAPGVILDVHGVNAGGELRLASTVGSMALGARFFAHGLDGEGGIIEAVAAADLTANGTFKSAGTPDGCIALSAGGTLDTSGGLFDVPPVADCPGSPSGAFLEAPDLL